MLAPRASEKDMGLNGYPVEGNQGDKDFRRAIYLV